MAEDFQLVVGESYKLSALYRFKTGLKNVVFLGEEEVDGLDRSIFREDSEDNKTYYIMFEPEFLANGSKGIDEPYVRTNSAPHCEHEEVFSLDGSGNYIDRTWDEFSPEVREGLINKIKALERVM